MYIQRIAEMRAKADALSHAIHINKGLSVLVMETCAQNTSLYTRTYRFRYTHSIYTILKTFYFLLGMLKGQCQEMDVAFYDMN